MSCNLYKVPCGFFQGTVTFTEDLENAVRNASFIFEAVFEDLNVKQNLFESKYTKEPFNSV